jgi:hypothetical protein
MAPEETAGEDTQRRQIEAEFLERLQDELSRLTVMDHLTQVLQTLPSLAFRHLGLTEESAAYRDLAQSRLAIDAFKALVDVLARQLTPDEVSLYRSTLAQMQMAYVAQVDRERTEAGAAETAASADGDAMAETTADDGAAGGSGTPGTGVDDAETDDATSDQEA